MQRAWRWECRQGDGPYLEASLYRDYKPRLLRGRLSGELCGSWWMSRRLCRLLKGSILEGEDCSLWGRGFSIDGVRSSVLETRAADTLALLLLARPTAEERFDQPPRLAEGWALCLDAEGFAERIREGESYYIREIPNMVGHVVVFPPGAHPLVGIHLDRFGPVAEVTDIRDGSPVSQVSGRPRVSTEHGEDGGPPHG